MIPECKDAARQGFGGHRRGVRKAPGSARESPLLDGTNAYVDYEFTPDEHVEEPQSTAGPSPWYRIQESREYAQSSVGNPGSARVPTPPAGPPPMHRIHESREEARCSNGNPGSARVPTPEEDRSRSPTQSVVGKYHALARAQCEARDSHRLWLDRKYKKRAWKRQAERGDHGYPNDLFERDWQELIARTPHYPPEEAPRG